jgi:chromate transporter
MRPTPFQDVTLAEAARVWARVAALSFGGPAGQIAVMNRILVEEKRWIGQRRFLQALNFCMLAPGPEAQQLATYIGWLMHGVRGGLVAGGLFVLPGFIALMGLSAAYALYGQVGVVAALFFGLKPAVLAIVLQAVGRMARRSLKSPALIAVAAGAFLTLYGFAAPFPLIVAGAGMIGFLGAALHLKAFRAAAPGEATPDEVADRDTALGEGTPEHAQPSLWRALILAAVILVLWLGPTALLVATLGSGDVFTFGGAYAVMAYVAQAAVGRYGWLKPGEMLDGLGMAETTPGPLIIVTEFVGFLAAFRRPGGLPPLVAGVLGGTLTTWATFTPSFLWVFVGGPFVERLRQARALSAALAAIGAAVTGVILNLAVWFAVHVLFARVETIGPLQVPVWASVDGPSVALALLAAVAVFGLRMGMFATLVGAAAAGVAWRVATGAV